MSKELDIEQEEGWGGRTILPLKLVIRLPQTIRVRLLARRGRQPNDQELAWAKKRAKELGLI